MSEQMRRLLLTLLEELESLIDADDGDVFQLQHIELVEELSDLMREEEHG